MAYEALAGEYDPLTRDVDYPAIADYLCGLLSERGINDGLLLDLACGTGTLSWELARRGYEVIGADASAEMLMIAQGKDDGSEKIPPVFIMQDMQTLDLYGTVRAAVCTLDGLNHLLTLDELREALHRLDLFIEPGGALIFDVNTPLKFARMDGQAYLDETEDVFCAWSVAQTDEKEIYEYCIDIFTRGRRGWDRSSESFCERAWSLDLLEKELARAGFEDIRRYGDRTNEAPAEDEQRVFFASKRKE